jgi:uncharacterized membrane protein
MKLMIKSKSVLPVLIILFLWNSGILITPLLAASSYPLFKLLAGWLYQLYDPVCHQLPERSWDIAGMPLPTCIRCTVFYFCGLLITFYYFVKKTIILFPVKFYILLMLPTAFDFILEMTGLYNDTPLIRTVTAILLAYALFHCLIRSLCSR